MELLTEIGYERLTTAQIALRAGVSKGAQTHHYPTKDDLLVAAFGHLLADWQARREAFAREQPGEAGVAPLLDYLWRDVFGRRDYLASIEMMLAARHHPALRERLRAVLGTWTTPRDDVFRRLVPLDDDNGQLDTFMQLNFCVLRGLALHGGLTGDESLNDRVRAMWLDIASAYVAGERKPDREPRGTPPPLPQ